MNRTVLYVIGAMAIIFVIAGVAGEKTKKSPPKSFVEGGSFRAVVVPADRPRTVVVTPCDAPSPSPTTGAGAARMPGVTNIRLDSTTGAPRTVLVPRCSTPANLPSAAFVLGDGDRPPAAVQAQVLVPSRSEAETIVVPPCRAGTGPVSGGQRQVVVQPRAPADTAVAPAC